MISIHLSDDDDPMNATSPRTRQFIRLYLEQDRSIKKSDAIQFDKIPVTESNQKTVLLSSRGLTSGKHEWSVQIWRTDVDLAEFGVSGIDRIPVSDGGAFNTKAYKSRAIYGSQMSNGMLFYGSCDANGRKRCHRDLRPFYKSCWTVGDVVTIKLDLDKYRIKYLLNGKAVRYTMSLESNKEYFPIICFSGNCKYFLQ